MTRILFSTAFLLGAIVVVWMASDFVGTDSMALTVTLVIGGVYVIGFIEQLQYRKATASLANALDSIKDRVENLDTWLNTLTPSLRNSVRGRIEGDRIALPAPVLTPYLVGLLVMLGLMGTFIGMVVTLKGAVIALEGTTELQAIRAGLTAPIGGLGLAFGTSVAGVAASAMLGLISTLSRRERMLETSRLDANISSKFREFSLVHNRQETFKALQFQATALPDVANKLNAATAQLESMSQAISDTLTANQKQFHEDMANTYKELATSVENTLKQTLVEGGKLSGESIKPIVKEMLDELAKDSKESQNNLNVLAQEQLATLSKGFASLTDDVNAVWQQSIDKQAQINADILSKFEDSVKVHNDTVSSTSLNLSEQFEKRTEELLANALASNEDTFQRQQQAIIQIQEASAENIRSASEGYQEKLEDITKAQKVIFEDSNNQLQSLLASIKSNLESMGQQSTALYGSVSDSLAETVEKITTKTGELAEQISTEVSKVVDESVNQVKARQVAEEALTKEQGERLNQLTTTLKDELVALRSEEQQRSDAAIDKLAELEAGVAKHLATLGQSLEEPMTNLIETASEAPKAAAELIEKLRQEISNNIEKDNGLLEERKGLIEELNQLAESISSTAAHQRDAVDALVSSSAEALKEVSQQFTQHIDSEVNKVAEAAEEFSANTIEISSLGEVFNTAVQNFSDSNNVMLENLTRVSESLENASSRSDEQLAYYVTQAREIIDHSMMSQKEIIEELKQLGRQPDLFDNELSLQES